MPVKKQYYERRWLNVKHGRAFTIAQVEVYSSKHVDVWLEIGDCYDAITLEFGYSASDKKDVNKQLKKLDGLIHTLTDLRAAMVAAQKEHDEGK